MMNQLNPIKVSKLLAQVENKTINFQGVLDTINSYYHYVPTNFVNGLVHNQAGQNEGSAKVFCFAVLNHLTTVDTLKLFAEHYESVKSDPKGASHANIRNFSFYGWEGFLMQKHCLTLKK